MLQSIKHQTGFIMTMMMVCSNGMAQSSFHMDPNRNSFTIQTPQLQQSYTRFFGGTNRLQTSNNNNALLASPVRNTNNNDVSYQQQQQQQFLPEQQQYTSPYSNQYPTQYQTDRDEQYRLQPQQQLNSQQQQTRLTDEDLNVYFQQVQRAQQLTSQPAPTEAFSSQQQQQSQLKAQTNNNLLGVVYSPSNKVSQVKFSSGTGLSYSF